MFTVKLIEERDNSETLFEASQVRCSVDITDPEMPRRIICDVPEGDQLCFNVRKARSANDGQTMFVMNRFGATVSRYSL